MAKRENVRMEKERQTVEYMIRLYCRHHEGYRELCPSCQELLEYVTARLHHCPFGANKPSCRLCPVHCYRPAMRERIRKVMRYAGPRMLWHHPIMAIRHLWNELMKQGKTGRKKAQGNASA